MLVRHLVPALVLGALASSSVAAKSWPTPAGGPSASGDPEVLFTFDDGPNPTYTPKILDILAEHHIHAVFFMVGDMVDSRSKKVPAIVERILREGHVIANHTRSHADLCRLKDPAKAAAEIDDGKASIERMAHVPVVWFRAPFGVRCARPEEQLPERATSHMHWDLDPQEWKTQDAAQTVSYVTRSLARARGRNVLLMHDIHAVSVKALPEILTWITEENTRRSAAKERPIRIVQAPTLAAEQLPAGLAAWTSDTLAHLAGLRDDVVAVLPPARHPHGPG